MGINKMVLVALLTTLTQWATAVVVWPQSSQHLITLHQEVDTTIDPGENARFALFDVENGFKVAKLYQQSDSKWTVHVYAEKNGRAWLVTKTLNVSQMGALRHRIDDLLRDPSQESGQKPVIKVDGPTDTGTETPQEIILVDNSRLYGRLTQVNPEIIQFTTKGELQVAIPDSMIAEVRWPAGQFVGEAFQRHDPSNIRLLFGPTGRTLKAGRGEFTDFYVVFPTLAFGITDFLMVGGGVSLVPGVSSQLVYVAPKIGIIRGDDLNLAAGFLYLHVPDENHFGTAYAALTMGSFRNSLSFALAFPTNSSDTSFDSPALMVGGDTQLSNSVKLLTENWLFTGNDSVLLLSGGIRFFGENLSADIGLFTSPDFFNETGFPFVPWVDFSVSFGK
jgi:hypothetical protein